MVAAFERSLKYKGKPVSKKATGKGPGRFITISGRQRTEEAEIDTDTLVVEAESSQYVSSALGNLLRAEPPKVGSSKKGSKKKNKKSSTEKATETGNRKEPKAASITPPQKQKDLQKRGRSRSTPRKPRPRSQSPELEARQTSLARKDQSGLMKKRVDSSPFEKEKTTTPHGGKSVGRNPSVSKLAITPTPGRPIAGEQIPSRRAKSAALRSEKKQRARSVVGGLTSAHQDRKSCTHGQVTAQRERSIVAKSKKKKKSTDAPSSSHSASDSDASASKDKGPDQSKGDRSKVEKLHQERPNGRSSPVGLAAAGNENDGKSKPLKITEGYELIAVRTKDGLLTAGILTNKGASTNTEDRETQHEIMDGKVGGNTKKSLPSKSPLDQSMTSRIEGDVDAGRPYDERQAERPAMSWEGLWTGFPARFTAWSSGEKYPSPHISESLPITIAETSEHGKKQGLPRKVLAAKILRVHDRGHMQYDDRLLPVVSCPVGHKRRDSKNYHPSKNPTPGRSSPSFPSSSGYTQRRSKASFSDGHSITSENAVHTAKQLRNELMSLTSAPSGSDEKTVKIENHAWREIVEAAETLDKKFIDVAKDGSNYFFSNGAINEINAALAKIRKHASHLNIDEKELIAAARDDDETKLKTILCRDGRINDRLESESQADGWVGMIKSYFDGTNCAPDKGKRPSKRYDEKSSVVTASIQTYEGRRLGQF
jgi:hypothetical protein